MEAKKKFFTPRLLLPVGAVLLLFGGFLFYYFLIVSRQEAILDALAFRSLAAVSGQLRDMVSKYAEVMHRSDQKEFRSFLAEQVPDLAIDEGPCPEAGPSVRTILREDGDALQFRHKASKEPPKSKEPKRSKESQEPNGPKESILCAHIRLETAVAPLLSRTSRELFDEMVLTTSTGRVLYQTQTAGILANDLSPFLQPVSDMPAVKNAPPAQGADHNAVPGKDAPYSLAFARDTQSSTLAMANLGGTRYRVYVVPVVITADNEKEATEKTILVLCGLTRQDRFQAAGRSMPGTALTMLVLTVLLIVVATWPLLKFSTMRLTERVTRNVGLYYALSATATIVLMIVLVIDIRDVFYDPETNENLLSLSQAIDRHMAQELKRALQVMDGIAQSEDLKDADWGKQLKTEEKELKDLPGCRSNQNTSKAQKANVLAEPGVQLAAYPYFRRFFAYDRYAYEHVNWTIDSTNPSSLRVCDRDYFNGTMRNELWYLTDDISGPRFRVDPVYSKLSGEYLAVIAEPFFHRLKATQEPQVSGVLTLVTPFLSLIRPVLPPDYGFAVIDESGKVLFHSDAARNSRENFFDETVHPGELQATITARRQAWLTIDYSGVTRRAFVSPITGIQHSPWYLITFSNPATAGTDQVERMVLFSALVLIYFVVIIVPCALILMLLRPNRVLWIWPRKKRRGRYHHVILTLVLLLALFYSLAFRAGPWELLIFAILVPLLSVFMAFFKLTSREDNIVWTAAIMSLAGAVMYLSGFHQGDWEFYLVYMLICAAFYFLSLKAVTKRLHQLHRQVKQLRRDLVKKLELNPKYRIHLKEWLLLRTPSFLTSFTLMSFCLLVMAAAPPCIALFKAAYDHEENMATRREQLLTMEALESREERVTRQYLKVKMSKESDPIYADDLQKWLFLRRRLEDENLDTYTTVFADQQEGQIFKQGALPEHTEPPALLNWLAGRLPYSHASITSKVSQNATERSLWEWDNEGTNRIRIHGRYDANIENSAGSPQTLALAKRVFNDPGFLSRQLAYDVNVLEALPFFISVAAPLFLLLCGMYFSVRSTLRRMFLVGVKMPQALPEITLDAAIERAYYAARQTQSAPHEKAGQEEMLLDEATKQPGNFILLGMPCSGKSGLLEARKNDISVINVALLIQSGGRVSDDLLPVVALDHFEIDMDNEAANKTKLELVEKLLRDEKKVLIITTIDPLFYLESTAEGTGDTSATGRERTRTLQRWGRALSDFTRGRLQSSDPTCSTACYRILWTSCTRNEQVALYGLAHDGWANYKNSAALEHLAERGMITDTPMFQLMPKYADFGAFISGTVTRDERKRWDIQHPAGYFDWDGLRGMFIILLTGTVAAVLFFNQQVVLGSLTSAISAVLPLAKALSDMRSSRNAAPAKSGGTAA
jgi:hypothetical protein